MPEYTLLAVSAVLAVVLVELWLRTGLFRRKAFWISYGIVLGFETIVDGVLTKLPDPVVIYNESEFSGLRFPFDIPVEDYLFGFGLVVLAILLWVRPER